MIRSPIPMYVRRSHKSFFNNSQHAPWGREGSKSTAPLTGSQAHQNWTFHSSWQARTRPDPAITSNQIRSRLSRMSCLTFLNGGCTLFFSGACLCGNTKTKTRNCTRYSASLGVTTPTHAEEWIDWWMDGWDIRSRGVFFWPSPPFYLFDWLIVWENSGMNECPASQPFTDFTKYYGWMGDHINRIASK
jgi:hypothetical protein